MNDVKFAFRQLLKNPGFTAVAVVTLALGIGVNTTAFSVLNALLLHTAPYPEPDALLRVYRTSPRGESGSHSPANFLDYRVQNTVFTEMAAIRVTDFNLGEPGQPADRIRGMSVTADFFPLLRTAPLLGRTFTPEEDRPGNNALVVISHNTWRQRFGGDPAVVGRTVRIDGETVAIIGVMPASFEDLQLWGDVAAWRPMALADLTVADRENTYLRVVARLKPAIALGQAQAAMSALSGRLALAYPQTNTELGIRLLQGRDFTDDEHAGNPAVVVINETMARTFWPGESPVGKRIGGATPYMSNPREIIGVVSDVRAAATLDDRGGRFQFYRSLAQWSFNSATIALRSRHAPESVAQDLRRALAELDSDQAVYRINTVRQEIDHGLGSIEVAARTLVGFALIGLLLAAVGIYGVIANSVVQRTNEIGIRMALGAQVCDIFALILGSGLRLTLSGTALGLAGTFGLAPILRAISPEFATSNAALTMLVTAFLILVALFACRLTARQAARVDPMEALRYE